MGFILGEKTKSLVFFAAGVWIGVFMGESFFFSGV